MEVIYAHPWVTVGFVSVIGMWLTMAFSQINKSDE